MPNSNGKEKDIKELLLTLRAQYGEYHRNKENMAWVATVLYIGFIFWISKFVIDHDLKRSGFIVLDIIIIITVLILGYYYIPEQLKMRRHAAYIVDACSSLYLKIVNGEIKLEVNNNMGLVEGEVIDKAIFPRFLQNEIDYWKKK